MRRTQLYLEDDLWQALHTRAKSEAVTVSQLVRDALRERYLGNLDRRRTAMLAFAGSGAGRTELSDTDGYVRQLRGGKRLQRLLE